MAFCYPVDQLLTPRPGTLLARLRRAQALAFSNGVAIQVTKELVRDKLLAQARLLEQHFESPLHGNVEALAEAVASGKNANEIRNVEAAGAALYWSVWSKEPVKFARRDTARVPEHWLSFGSRSSAITGTPRSASNPANALLNYAYAVLEAEATIALATMGLDPGLGVFHTDLRARDSLACDIMEPLRPSADELVLRVLRTRVFSARDFHESRDGVCRISASLALALCDLAPTLRPLLATRTEELASRLLKSGLADARAERGIPTLLSGENRKAVKSRKPTVAKRPAFPRACQECGATIPERKRLCETCGADVRVRSREFIAAGPNALERLRRGERDPAHGGKATERRATTMSARNRARREWTTDGADYTEERFRRDILPAIQAIPLNELRRRTGLSLRYVSLIRRGEKVPHPRHWRKLSQPNDT